MTGNKVKDKRLEQVVVEGNYKADPDGSHMCGKESFFELSIMDDITVERGCTTASYLFRVRNEAGDYIGKGYLTYQYKNESGDVIEASVLNVDGTPPKGAVTDSNGRVVKVECAIEDTESKERSSESYFVSSLKLSFDLLRCGGSFTEECKIDKEVFLEHVRDLELKIFEGHEYSRVVDFVESTKMKSQGA